MQPRVRRPEIKHGFNLMPSSRLPYSKQGREIRSAGRRAKGQRRSHLKDLVKLDKSEFDSHGFDDGGAKGQLPSL